MRDNMNFSGLIVFLVLSLSFLTYAEADADERGLEIMRKNYEQMTTKNWRSDVVMQLVSRSGKIQTRHLKRLSKTDGEDQEKYHLRFIEPPRIRNTTLLILENKDRESDMWFYLPAIKKVKSISGSNQRASYMGTEFSYKDLKRENVSPEHNRYVFVDTEDINGVGHFVIDAFPISEQEKLEQGYQKRRLWVRSDNYLASRINYYDEEGEYLKTLVGSDMRTVGESGKVRFFKLTMSNTKGVKTILEFRLLRINEENPEDKYFTRTYLKRM